MINLQPKVRTVSTGNLVRSLILFMLSLGYAGHAAGHGHFTSVNRDRVLVLEVDSRFNTGRLR